MIIQFFKHGKGGGAAPVNYLVATHSPLRNADGSPVRDADGQVVMVERSPAPAVVRGDAWMMREIIDSVPHAWRYTSGVISWAPEDQPTDKQFEEVMEQFEQTFFAGLDFDQYSILWVRHQHAGHEELHFIVPRMELKTGKSLNIRPPKSESDFDAFRDFYDAKYQWGSPGDPLRSRLLRCPHHEAKLDAHLLRRKLEKGENPRKIVHAHLIKMAGAGLIGSQADIIQELRILGLAVHRVGDKYVSFRDATSKKTSRLRGLLYERNFNLERILEEGDQEKRVRIAEDNGERIAELERALAAVREKRARYNLERYFSEAQGVSAGDEQAFGQVGGGNRQEMVEMVGGDVSACPVLVPDFSGFGDSSDGHESCCQGWGSVGTEGTDSRGGPEVGGVEAGGDHFTDGRARFLAGVGPSVDSHGKKRQGRRGVDSSTVEVSDDGVGSDFTSSAATIGTRIDCLIGVAEGANRLLEQASSGLTACVRNLVQVVAQFGVLMRPENDHSAGRMGESKFDL